MLYLYSECSELKLCFKSECNCRQRVGSFIVKVTMNLPLLKRYLKIGVRCGLLHLGAYVIDSC